jgi:hypothetical protein
MERIFARYQRNPNKNEPPISCVQHQNRQSREIRHLRRLVLNVSHNWLFVCLFVFFGSPTTQNADTGHEESGVARKQSKKVCRGRDANIDAVERCADTRTTGVCRRVVDDDNSDNELETRCVCVDDQRPCRSRFVACATDSRTGARTDASQSDRRESMNQQQSPIKRELVIQNNAFDCSLVTLVRNWRKHLPISVATHFI